MQGFLIVKSGQGFAEKVTMQENVFGAPAEFLLTARMIRVA
jgi:hypothetical protein